MKNDKYPDLMIFTGNANYPLAKEIADYIGKDLANAEVGQFADGETLVKIKDNVRGRDTYVIQPTCPPVNHNLMELLTIIDALRRSSAKRITAVIPYYGYARQDRKVQPRVPITAKLVANLLTAAGVNRILTLDLHAGQIQGFFDIPVDHLFAAPVIIDYFKEKNYDDLVVASPDAGGVERARAVAKRLSASIAMIDKRRPKENEAEVMHVIGEVKNKKVLILDDIIDTGNTIIKAAHALLKEGADEIYTCCIHPVLSKSASEILKDSPIKELVVTNTIPLKEERPKNVKVLSVAKLLGEAIIRIHTESSVSSLFI
jgi:ribose-phosphate pyrophosphokinase